MGGWIETFEQCFARAQKQDFLEDIYKLMWETGKTGGLGPNSTHAVLRGSAVRTLRSNFGAS